MENSDDLLSKAKIEDAILEIRGERVLLDADLAFLYGVETKALNQAVKRNRERFPQKFMFQLTRDERSELVKNGDQYKKLKHSTVLPHVFTEYGAMMLANVVNSSRAIEMSIYIVEAFIRLREFLSSQRVIAQKLDQLEHRISGHDLQIRALFDAIRELMKGPESRRKRIGFQAKDGV